jgi:hypothetical protein
MLRPISFEALNTTLPILSRGFPALRRDAWSAGLARLHRYGERSAHARAGYLLEANGREVGIILTIPSMREDGGAAGQPVVNLSSWYIEPDQRWRAPRMLQSVLTCNATLYTDLTPSPPVRAMIGRLGFRGWTEGTLLFALALFALRSAGVSHVVPLRDLPPDAFPAPTRRMLDEHAGFDCLCGGLWDGNALHPVIFSRKVYRGIPLARLIFTDARAIVLAHIAAISRFLLREKFLLLAVNADRSERIAGSVFTQRTAPTFYKGPSAPAQCDFAYSEFAFLQV